MGSNENFRDKMDALDLIIRALMDHEKRLDKISRRLGVLVSRTDRPDRAPRSPEGLRSEPSESQEPEDALTSQSPLPPRRDEAAPRILVRKWSDFTAAGHGSTLVAFDLVDNRFTVGALLESRVLTYVEELPATRVKVSEAPTHLAIDRASVGTIDALHSLLQKHLRCGLPLTVNSTRTRLSDHEYLLELQYTLNTEGVKTFLADALGVARDRIVEGQITV